jgi:hypothetical protein
MANAMSARAAFPRPESVNDTAALIDRVLSTAEATVSNFLDTVRTLRTTEEAFTRPCVMMSACQFKLGEFDEVVNPASGEYTRRYVILNPMMGWSSDRIASLFLSDESGTRLYLTPIVVCLLSIDLFGEVRGNGERCLVMIDEFTRYLNERAETRA